MAGDTVEQIALIRILAIQGKIGRLQSGAKPPGPIAAGLSRPQPAKP